MNRMMQLEAVVGFFWVIEWTEDHHYHAHVVFWLDGSKTQNTYPWAQQSRFVLVYMTKTQQKYGCYCSVAMRSPNDLQAETAT